mmetsp:Transcript_20581/g.44697  ORF Transcript_20581/g.44697 Transcript_20581/m.44697 type:complete len:159 (-) Transcript_20581:136-612(-)
MPSFASPNTFLPMHYIACTGLHAIKARLDDIEAWVNRRVEDRQRNVEANQRYTEQGVLGANQRRGAEFRTPGQPVPLHAGPIGGRVGNMTASAVLPPQPAVVVVVVVVAVDPIGRHINTMGPGSLQPSVAARGVAVDPTPRRRFDRKASGANPNQVVE